MNPPLNSDVGKPLEPAIKCHGSTLDLGGSILPVTKKGVMMERPDWVWLICIFTCFSACWTMLSFYLIFSDRIPLNPAQMSYFASLTPLDLALEMLQAVITVVAAAFLFLLRRQCVPLFGVGIILGILQTVGHVLTKGFLAALPEGAGIGWLIGIAIQLAVILYSRRLAQRGVLT